MQRGTGDPDDAGTQPLDSSVRMIRNVVLSPVLDLRRGVLDRFKPVHVKHSSHIERIGSVALNGYKSPNAPDASVIAAWQASGLGSGRALSTNPGNYAVAGGLSARSTAPDRSQIA